MGNTINPADIITPVFAGMGALFLLIIWLIQKRRQRIIAKGHNTTGKIVDIIRTRGSKGGYNYQPVIEYTPFMQGKIVKKHPFGSTGYNKYKVGDEVEIFYDPDKPERYVIKDDKAIRILFWVFGVMGVLFILLGIFLRYFLQTRFPAP